MSSGMTTALAGGDGGAAGLNRRPSQDMARV
jgi:hypothetical protein